MRAGIGHKLSESRAAPKRGQDRRAYGKIYAGNGCGVKRDGATRGVSMDQKIDDLFEGLKALSASAFPKQCTVCGRTYATVEQFVQETESIQKKSGLKRSADDDDHTIVELFRNCPCGSTLMDAFSDRRDTSEAGLRRRGLFGKLMELLTQKGVEAGRARTELLKFIKGQPSALLEKMGIKTKA